MGAPQDEVTVNDVGTFVWLRGGAFQLGESDDPEWPSTPAEVDGFWCGVHPLQARAARAVGFAVDPALADDEILTGLSWRDSITLANELSVRAGLKPVYRDDGDAVQWDPTANGLRLPTEVEWEYACRAGTNTRRGQLLGDEARSWFRIRQRPAPLDTLWVNAWGLVGMLEGVREWVWDWLDVYPEQAPAGYRGPLRSELSEPMRVLRGGAFDLDPSEWSCARRAGGAPSERAGNHGVRLVLAGPRDAVLARLGQNAPMVDPAPDELRAAPAAASAEAQSPYDWIATADWGAKDLASGSLGEDGEAAQAAEIWEDEPAETPDPDDPRLWAARGRPAEAWHVRRAVLARVAQPLFHDRLMRLLELRTLALPLVLTEHAANTAWVQGWTTVENEVDDRTTWRASTLEEIDALEARADQLLAELGARLGPLAARTSWMGRSTALPAALSRGDDSVEAFANAAHRVASPALVFAPGDASFLVELEALAERERLRQEALAALAARLGPARAAVDAGLVAASPELFTTELAHLDLDELAEALEAVADWLRHLDLGGGAGATRPDTRGVDWPPPLPPFAPYATLPVAGLEACWGAMQRLLANRERADAWATALADADASWTAVHQLARRAGVTPVREPAELLRRLDAETARLRLAAGGADAAWGTDERVGAFGGLPLTLARAAAGLLAELDRAERRRQEEVARTEAEERQTRAEAEARRARIETELGVPLTRVPAGLRTDLERAPERPLGAEREMLGMLTRAGWSPARMDRLARLAERARGRPGVAQMRALFSALEGLGGDGAATSVTTVSSVRAALEEVEAAARTGFPAWVDGGTLRLPALVLFTKEWEWGEEEDST